MTARDDDEVDTKVWPVTAETLWAVSPLPPEEEVFADWLMSVPDDADLEEAARKQVALIDSRLPFHPDVQCLRMMLVAVAGGALTKPARNL